MNQLARVREEWRGDIAVASIDGEIDASNVGTVGSRLRDMLGNQAHGLVIDLSGTE